MKATGKFNRLSSWLIMIVVLFFNSFVLECIVHADQSANSLIDGNSKSVTAGESSPSNGTDFKLPPDFFPILPWDWCDKGNEINFNNGLSSVADCKFTMSLFVQSENLPSCEKLVLMSIMNTFAKEGTDVLLAKKALSDEEIDTKVKQMVESSGNSKAILGYYIIDEPGASCFPLLAKVLQAVRKYAPGKLALINLFPNYATNYSTSGSKDLSQLEANSYADYLERFVNEVKPQIICYDNYMVPLSNDLTNETAANSYYTNLMEVRRVALKHNLPFWQVVSSNQISLNSPIPSPSNLFFQAYTTLAAGGKGIGWWSYYTRKGYRYAPVDKFNNEKDFVINTDKKTLTWRYMQEVNRQTSIIGQLMTHLTSTGVYFTHPAPVESFLVLPGKVVKDVKSDTPMMIGEFKCDDGKDYVMIVNLSLQKSAKFILDTIKSYQKIQFISAEDGTLCPIDNKEGVWLVAGQGVLIKLSMEN